MTFRLRSAETSEALGLRHLTTGSRMPSSSPSSAADPSDVRPVLFYFARRWPAANDCGVSAMILDASFPAWVMSRRPSRT